MWVTSWWLRCSVPVLERQTAVLFRMCCRYSGGSEWPLDLSGNLHAARYGTYNSLWCAAPRYQSHCPVKMMLSLFFPDGIFSRDVPWSYIVFLTSNSQCSRVWCLLFNLIPEPSQQASNCCVPLCCVNPVASSSRYLHGQSIGSLLLLWQETTQGSFILIQRAFLGNRVLILSHKVKATEHHSQNNTKCANLEFLVRVDVFKGGRRNYSSPNLAGLNMENGARCTWYQVTLLAFWEEFKI